MRTQDANPFFDFRWGVERETHRMQPDGRLSLARHPAAFRKPAFTLDFAESQLEIVTSPGDSIPDVLRELEGLTLKVRQIIEPELLWPFSMPPRLPSEAEIPIAELDRRAVLYRRGLALRYGKTRQMICGVHLNISFGSGMIAWLSRVAPLAKGEDSYQLRLMRNLYPELPNFVLLFGASPILEGSEALAISHRNGPSGYAREGFLPYLDLSSFEAYLAGIHRGLSAESTEFADLGLVRDGHVLQLNTRVFQTEKEFYAPIRLRQTALPGESGLQALSKRGPGYLELRFLDVDPFRFSGVSEDALRLLHLFLLDALSCPSSPRGSEDLRATTDVARMDPLRDWKDARFERLEIRLSELEDWARRLDDVEGWGAYSRSLHGFQVRAANPLLLPSATLARLFQESGSDWTRFGIRTAQMHSQGAGHVLEHTRV